MVNVLVALDHSDHSKAAFYNALMLMRNPEDVLYLVSVMQEYPAFAVGGVFTPSDAFSAVDGETKKAYTNLLQEYAQLCIHDKIEFHLLLAHSNHIGEMLCQTVEEKKIDYLVLGRKGSSRIKRVFMGSTSKFCMEHASCNVLVVKEVLDSAHLLQHEKSLGEIRNLSEDIKLTRSQEVHRRTHNVKMQSQ
ncbi:hypothetical protein PROFUN_02514 [Planoprotostelium fungivorum]|uniref:UspA domain-containing protein n=1 Tax=Planoprotostelium fungivorum TaxID=1890364 RepID=A0A2P6MP97_9EUKA|nr:hypothetical protein PROFUN_02514 [Planoprotostelium fungivorum]